MYGVLIDLICSNNSSSWSIFKNKILLKVKSYEAIAEDKFVIVNSNKFEIDFLESTQMDIKSNIDLMRLIKDFEACNEEYKRHFKLNKLLR